MPSSKTMEPEAICSCTSMAGMLVLIHAGRVVELKPNSSIL